MSLISYPRTAADLKSVLSLGYEEVMRLLRENRLYVNLRSFLQHLFKEKKYDDNAIDSLNQKLLTWQEDRTKKGLPNAALVYHHSGARSLHGFKIEKVNYERKTNRIQYQHERKREFQRESRKWLKEIAVTHAKDLKAAGIPQKEIDKMATTGERPMDANGKLYQVHHRLPLDDGGTNDPSNFILIRDNVEHRAVHGYYNPAELRIDRLPYGEKAEVALPMPPKDTIIYPDPPRGYVAEIVPNTDLLEIYDEH